jgi:hypothetical protein
MRAVLGRHALVAVLGLAGGCKAGGAGGLDGPRLEVRWTGADTAAFSARATAEWCDSLKLLEIRAMAGDTGVGLALYPRGGLEPGVYPIRRPEIADTTPPAAAVALRWFSQAAVRGFRGDSGELSLRRAPGGTFSGQFTATAHAVLGGERLSLTGSFDDLRERPATRGCATPRPDPAPALPDSTQGVD